MRRLRQNRPLGDPVEEAMVNLMLAASWLGSRVDAALAPLGISHVQYNVLRILKGAGPAGHPRCEIACRMIDRAPDVTRILDRMERQGLVSRARGVDDRRQSVSRLTPKGAAVLEKASAALVAVHEVVGGRLGVAESRSLSRSCEALYGADTETE